MTELHLAVGLDGYGWHPQAWRYAFAHNATGGGQLGGRYWAALAGTAERGLLDFLTIEDSLDAQPGRRATISPRRLVGRADATLVAARIAPVTTHIGLIPVATVTHTEPFHVSKAIATLDHISHGRAGWQVRVSPTAHEAALFGRAARPRRRRAVRRGRRRRGGGAPPLGQLGGRRRHPRCRDRSLHRPRQAALHRLRRKALLGQGTLDHPAAAPGPARGGGTGTRAARLRIRRRQRRPRVRHPA